MDISFIQFMQPAATLLAPVIAGYYITKGYFKNKLYDKKVEALVEIFTGVNKYMEEIKVLHGRNHVHDDYQLDNPSGNEFLDHTKIVCARIARYQRESDTIIRVKNSINFWFPELEDDLKLLITEVEVMIGNIFEYAFTQKDAGSALAAMGYPYKEYKTIALYDNLIDRLRHHLPK